MKSIEQYKNIDPDLQELSDEEVSKLCDDFQKLAQFAFEQWVTGSKYRQWFLSAEVSQI